ncbi:heme exporter protein CcmD [Alteromonas sp. 345S023]|uniref:Heme exporter protein D n=1 Tax=Alteromonas profundi TaxID=2696062 RepID=A0A7X5RJK6_9ALTE|nr:heme exporter protein CcmD [Alteromonas profundi]NDV89744.1 heme exporter protein CcmD [Alteromonas profundi]
MQFESFSSFLAMGGYAFYVWMSFAVTFGAMLLLAVGSYRQHKVLLKSVVAEQARQSRIKRARAKTADISPE